MRKMRAKLVVTEIKSHGDSDRVTFRAVCKNEGYPEDGSDENNSFAQWTPDAELNMTINNPILIGTFRMDQEFYVDFAEIV